MELFPSPTLGSYGVHTSRITPLNPPDILGGNRKSSSLPFTRGGLGWGKTLVNQLFQTCVYTVALGRGEQILQFPFSHIWEKGLGDEGCL
jgi:hypothetical protein